MRLLSPTPPTGSLATTPRERGVLAGTFYLAGGIVALLAATAPHAHTGWLAALAASALAVAALAYALRDRFVYWATLASSVAGPLLIAVGIVVGDGGWGSAVIATVYTFVAVHTALVLRRGHAAVIQVLGVATAVLASGLVAPDLPLAVVAATYALVCGTLWGVTTRLVEHVRHRAATDPLTGLANRATFSHALDHAQATVRRTHEPLSLAALDLDGFKHLNDTRGHAAGDAALVAAGRAWSAQLRARDTLARTGGDEFMAILPGAGAEEAAEVAARLQAATPTTVACSVGVATWDHDQTAEQLVRASDRALYRAKAQRRQAAACQKVDAS